MTQDIDKLIDAVHIIDCDHLGALPEVNLRAYSLNEHYTQADAVRDYVKRYGREPETGYRWKSYLYLEIPLENGTCGVVK
jgi:hypothetical protein